MIPFVAGLILGEVIGIVVAGLCWAASDNKERREH